MWSSSRSRRAERLAAAAAAVALLGVLAATAPAHARMQAAAVAPGAGPGPDHVRRYFEDARPLGAGRLTWFGLHVYDAQLFVPRQFDVANPGAQPFALELTYARSLSGQAIAERSADEISKLAIGNDAERVRWRNSMAALFPDVKAGQRLAGIYRPDAPTRFYLDGRFLGEIADPAFGRAFFAIWLDPRTSVPQLRSRLLQSTP